MKRKMIVGATVCLLLLVMGVACTEDFTLAEELLFKIKGITITSDKTELSLSAPVATLDASLWTADGLATPTSISYVWADGTEHTVPPEEPGIYKAKVLVAGEVLELSCEF